MRTIAQVISWLSLVLLLAPSVLFLMNRMPLETVKTTMTVATVVWFVSASLWMWNPKKQ